MAGRWRALQVPQPGCRLCIVFSVYVNPHVAE
jgi:hypothetical protein